MEAEAVCKYNRFQIPESNSMPLCDSSGWLLDLKTLIGHFAVSLRVFCFVIFTLNANVFVILRFYQGCELKLPFRLFHVLAQYKKVVKFLMTLKLIYDTECPHFFFFCHLNRTCRQGDYVGEKNTRSF